MPGVPHLTIRLDGAGWLSSEVGDAVTECTALASYFSDPLLDLLDAVLALWYGASEAVAIWWEEPDSERPFEYAHWRLAPVDDNWELQLRGDLDGYGHTATAKVYFSTTMTAEEITTLVVEAIRACVEGVTDEEYRDLWYAEAELGEIHEVIDQINAAQRREQTAAVAQRLRKARINEGGYWSDLVPPAPTD